MLLARALRSWRQIVVAIAVLAVAIAIGAATTAHTWPSIRTQLQRLHVGTFTGPAGVFRRRTEITKPQHDILAKLDLPIPKQIIELDIPA